MKHNELWWAVQMIQWICIAATVVVLVGGLFFATIGIKPRRRTE